MPDALRQTSAASTTAPRASTSATNVPPAPVQAAVRNDDPTHPLRAARRLREGCALAVGVDQPGPARHPPAARPTRRPTDRRRGRQARRSRGSTPAGVFVWLTMTTGARRGELCALRWCDVDLAAGVITVRRASPRTGDSREEKDTKTHQQRRVALDPETIAVLTEHRERWTQRAAALGSSSRPPRSSSPPTRTADAPRASVSQRYGRTRAASASTPTSTACATTPPPS